MKTLVVCGIVIFLTVSLLTQQLESDNDIHILLQKSVPFVGTETPRMQGADGSGIRIAIIDTGVDFEHPDLLGWGPGKKVVGGFNFIQQGSLPRDTNGHGTQVAGVIAADGQIQGMAPKAEILSYKVSEDGEGVSPELIMQAIKKAIKDKADIINISLGVNKTNAQIERAVNLASQNGILVVTAAGNDGPDSETIGSPGRNFKSITVGATYNNLTSSLVATLEVDKKPYTVIPMIGTSKLLEPITEKLVFGGYGKVNDFEELDVKDAIVIVERGSDDDEEMLYFSAKEENAAAAGARALIIYNNQPGIFLGELIHEFIRPGYVPQIPVVSIDRQEGLEIIESDSGVLHLFYNPDYVAHFSSRGPVSPFYIKPDILAPGAYINTTQKHAGYNITSGTSYAAPHVSGAAALLLQKNPELIPQEIKSLLLTTSKPVSDAYGNEFSIHDAGAGRLDIKSAFDARLVITPPNFVVSASTDDPVAQQQLHLKPLRGAINDISVEFVGPEFIEFSHVLEKDTLYITMSVNEERFGSHEGRIILYHDNTRYTIPHIIHYTQGSISAVQQDTRIYFDVYHPKEWSFAKITVTDTDGDTRIVTATPYKNAFLDIYKNSIYWIDAKIRVDGNSSKAFDIIKTDMIESDKMYVYIPERPILIIGVILGGVCIFGIIKTRF